MNLVVEKSTLSGKVTIPASKSHTIRAVCIAALADGQSEIRNPLVANDTLSAVNGCRAFGADFVLNDNWTVTGVSNRPAVPDNILDVGNSGTSLYILMGIAALCSGYTVFTGDSQIRARPAMPLLDAFNNLGAEAFSTRANGAAPLVVKGPMRGGQIELDSSKTSQYLTSLLISCPLAQGDTVIRPKNVIEQPYIEMTLDWLKGQGIKIERNGFDEFKIPGGQSYKGFNKHIPGDFSSAAFFLCAAAITGDEIVLEGLDINDTQGDKAILDMLAAMGAQIRHMPEGILIKGGELRSVELDLNATPDALPALAVTACFAEGVTKLVNVPQARLKETDRISVMAKELSKMGADIRELPDGLEIRRSNLKACELHGWNDHRVVMALAVAALACEGVTRIDTAESMRVTFPSFVELMVRLGAKMALVSD